jgi:hypothetical protein
MDETHDWDGVPDMPTWRDIYTADELVLALEFTSARLAAKHGYYDIADELQSAADCIRDLQEQVDELRKAGADLVRNVMASRESLS